MPKKRSLDDLSEDELRWMLVEKRRTARQERLERFRRSGRAVILTPDVEGASLENIRSGTLTESEEIVPAQRSRRRRFLDALLLIVEISAVIGFLFILYSGLNMIRELNQEVVIALEQPTLTPTPLIVAVVLPSGHTPPNSQGSSRPNDAEIPEHLSPIVQSLASVPLPTASPGQANRIQIPAIDIDAPVVQGDGWEQLKKGVGQHVGSADPGNKGNIVLSAHNDIFGELFRDLDRLQNGDNVVLFTSQRSYNYVVVDTKIVEPTDVEVMAPSNQPTLTLISCYPYLVDNKRIVVITRLQSGG